MVNLKAKLHEQTSIQKTKKANDEKRSQCQGDISQETPVWVYWVSSQKDD